MASANRTAGRIPETAAYNSALVAQGAFSPTGRKTSRLSAAGQTRSARTFVLTWTMMDRRGAHSIDLPFGGPLAYSDDGSGRPSVLVHGWSCSRVFFGRNVRALSERFRIISVDLPPQEVRAVTLLP